MSDIMPPEGFRLPPTIKTQARMQRTRRRDTPAERLLRAALYRRGLRYRVDHRIVGLRARPDVAFITARVAVFVDGCFWHGCPLHGTYPKRNAIWWKEKLDGNQRRDRESKICLERLGWLVLRYWEHEDVQHTADVIAAAVTKRTASALAAPRRRFISAGRG